MPSQATLYYFEIPLLLLYLFICVLLSLSKRIIFRTAFFRFFVFIGFSNITRYCYAFSMRILKSKAPSIFVDFSTVIDFMGFFDKGSSFVNIFGSVFVCHNRYSAVSNPQDFSTKWNEHKVRQCLVCIFGLSMASQVFIPILMIFCYFEYGNTNYTVLITGVTTYTRLYYFCIITPCILICFGFNCAAVIAIHQMKTLHATMKKAPLSLLVYSICSAAVAVPFASFQIIRFLGDIYKNPVLVAWISEQFFWINDVYTFANLLLLLLFSSEVRSEIKLLIGKKILLRASRRPTIVLTKSTV